jgi:glutathione S-transferase
VPAFVDDDGFSLLESRAINKYLATKKPDRDLDPADPQRRALSDQWSFWQAIHLGPAMQAIAFEHVFKARFKMVDFRTRVAHGRKVILDPIDEWSDDFCESLGAWAPIGQFDAMIAAHALVLKLVLVTNNAKHFDRVLGLRCENWV